MFYLQRHRPRDGVTCPGFPAALWPGWDLCAGATRRGRNGSDHLCHPEPGLSLCSLQEQKRVGAAPAPASCVSGPARSPCGLSFYVSLADAWSSPASVLAPASPTLRCLLPAPHWAAGEPLQILSLSRCCPCPPSHFAAGGDTPKCYRGSELRRFKTQSPSPTRQSEEVPVASCPARFPRASWGSLPCISGRHCRSFLSRDFCRDGKGPGWTARLLGWWGSG